MFDGLEYVAIPVWERTNRSRYDTAEWAGKFLKTFSQFRHAYLHATGILLPPTAGDEEEVQFMFGLPVKHTDAVDEPVFTFKVCS